MCFFGICLREGRRARHRLDQGGIHKIIRQLVLAEYGLVVCGIADIIIGEEVIHHFRW